MKKLLVIAICLALTGCAGVRGLESSAVIKAVAFDESDKGFLLTVCVLNPDGEKPYITIGTETDSMTDAIAMLSATTERTPYLAQCEVMVISEKLGGDVVSDVIDFFYLYSEGAKDMLLCTSRGSAADMLSYSEGLYKEPAVDISRTLRNAAETDGSILLSLSGARLALGGAAGCCMIPTCEMPEGSESFTVTGAGILSGRGFSGQLSTEELLGAKWLLSEGAHANFSVKGTNGRAGIRLSRVRTGTDAFYAAEPFFSFETAADYSVLQGSISRTELEKHMRECMKAAFGRAQRDGDFMGLGSELGDRTAGKDWNGELRRAEAEFSVTARAVGGGYPGGGIL